MLTSLSKILLLCALVSYCAGEELAQSQGPFKPVSPVPLNPQISQIMSALQSNQMPFNPFASSMAMKMMMGNSDSISLMKISDMPEISRIMCSCETSMEAERCLTGETKKKIENFEEIKTITNKLEKLLNKHVFKSVIVKRSIEQLEEAAGQELVANGKDAKHDIELMLNIYDNIKKMLQISSDKDVEAFKSKLLSMPEKQMTLRQLIDELKSTKTESCEDEEHTIECTPGTQLKIIKAAISNKNKFACPAMIRKSPLKSLSEDVESCYEEEMTTKLMNATCGGRQECTVSVHRDFLNICKCAEQKYLEVTYTCEAAKPEDAHKLSRSKRTLHYRNKPKQEKRDKLMRSGGLFGGLYDYGLYGGYGLPFYDYGLYGYGFPFYDYYGLYGYGYGLPFYDYYGYGYGLPFVGAFTYDYDNGYGNNGGYGKGGQAKGGYGKGGYGKGGNGNGSADDTA